LRKAKSKEEEVKKTRHLNIRDSLSKLALGEAVLTKK
jgi:hypothetical protein